MQILEIAFLWSSSKNSRKISINFYSWNEAERDLGLPRGTHHASTPCVGAGYPLAAPRPGEGSPWSSTYSSASHYFLSLEKNMTPLLVLEFLPFLLAIFDLLAQPIISAEIWSICSPVCDSYNYPSRILFSGVFLEYFTAIGDMLSELGCLYYAYINCLDACLVLLQVFIVFPFNCLF